MMLQSRNPQVFSDSCSMTQRPADQKYSSFTTNPNPNHNQHLPLSAPTKGTQHSHKRSISLENGVGEGWRERDTAESFHLFYQLVHSWGINAILKPLLWQNETRPSDTLFSWLFCPCFTLRMLTWRPACVTLRSSGLGSYSLYFSS